MLKIILLILGALVLLTIQYSPTLAQLESAKEVEESQETIFLSSSALAQEGIESASTGKELVQNSAINNTDTGKTKRVTLIAKESVVQVAPDNALHPGGIKYNAMTFNGTIPGPVISVDQGDKLEITLRNEGEAFYSLVFQAGNGANQPKSGTVQPRESKTWSTVVNQPGAFLYYGSGDRLNGIWEHIANGMFGGVVVHSKDEKPAKEFYLLFSEIYNTEDQGPFKGTGGRTGSFDLVKFITNQPDLILTNGMAHKYLPTIGDDALLTLNRDAETFKAKPDELTRWYIFNAGPRESVTFNFVGSLLNIKDSSNSSDNSTSNTQIENTGVWTIPPGSGSIIETTFSEEGEYFGIDTDMGRFVKGAGFTVMASNNSTSVDHPIGTQVPPAGSQAITSNTSSTISPSIPSPSDSTVSSPSGGDLAADTLPSNAGSGLSVITENFYEDNFGYVHVVGEVRNDLDRTMNFVQANVAFYDSQKKIIGTDFTYTDPSTISSGSTATYEIMTNKDSLASSDVDSIQTRFEWR